ncbi:hypothetical protein GDO81_016639 [Engystomops pustulosus]|uniref:BLUF domain-containing protein n=1 Tax=Engystomops pustulosus TaxID=76066 RepID=A0AAV7AC16_ENGPU|nr:hypothetical protein GDO81_016639 [Engystomops pustulosus]KAG8557459.1 hypothetical protein GDO81_016639 [Engystomops pustulosus]KAG8557460.1 hypothetical protein GDO81_016639 [Engystomops pustulosus]
MASRQRCSSTPALPHVSALTVLLEAQHMKSIIHRLIYVARISPERANCNALPEHYERLFNRLIKSNLGESISGLLLLYPSCVIHMIEASSEILTGINQDLIQIQNQGAEPLLQDIKILVISHNIQSRLFPQWYFRIVRLPTKYLADFGNSQSEDSVVEECLTLMMKLGMFLSKVLKPGSKGPGENLHDLVPELLVREEIICFLLRSGRFLSPEEFTTMYNKPINSPVTSDLLWPAPQLPDL